MDGDRYRRQRETAWVVFGKGTSTLSGLRTYGECLGVAFQARDDLLGIWGEPDRTGGRPPRFDLRARKAALPVAFALHEGGETADGLRELLARPEPGDDDVARATKLVEQGGGRDRTAELASSKVDDAVAAMLALDLPGDITKGFVERAEMGRPDY